MNTTVLGRTTSNGYTFVRRIGAGTFSEVYHVRDRAGADFALKLFLQDDLPRNSTWAREVQAHGHLAEYPLNADHVIVMFERFSLRFQGDERRYVAIVMELMDGTLCDLRFYDFASVLDCMLQLAAGLQHIHERHCAHSDIKPENCLYRAVRSRQYDSGIERRIGNQPHHGAILFKIGDLGFACLSSTCKLRGTVSYIPPDVMQIVRSGVDIVQLRRVQKMDVWALGKIFFEVLIALARQVSVEDAGVCFEGDSERQIHLFVDTTMEVLQSYVDDRELRNSLALLIKQMLSTDHENRPSAREAHEFIEQLVFIHLRNCRAPVQIHVIAQPETSPQTGTENSTESDSESHSASDPDSTCGSDSIANDSPDSQGGEHMPLVMNSSPEARRASASSDSDDLAIIHVPQKGGDSKEAGHSAMLPEIDRPLVCADPGVGKPHLVFSRIRKALPKILSV